MNKENIGYYESNIQTSRNAENIKDARKDGVVAIKLLSLEKQIEDLQKENEQIKKTVKTYEDPEDLTLMYMYCGEKLKEKIEKLQQENERLKNTTFKIGIGCESSIKTTLKYYSKSMMNLNACEEVINGTGTFETIARNLLEDGKCIIGWTDQEMDHRDILFTYHPFHLAGGLQRGLRWNDLYVSIIGHTSAGFLMEPNGNNQKASGYIREKLRLDDNHCDREICKLVSGVIEYIDALGT